MVRIDALNRKIFGRTSEGQAWSQAEETAATGDSPSTPPPQDLGRFPVLVSPGLPRSTARTLALAAQIGIVEFHSPRSRILGITMRHRSWNWLMH